MASKNRVNVSTGPTIVPMSLKDKHAARVAELANQQSELKQEAAERRAIREAKTAANSKPLGNP